MLKPRNTPTEVTDLEDATVTLEDGSVRSVQAATVEMNAGDLEQLWHPIYMERLARTYWRYLSHITFHLIRVKYRPDGRDVVLLFKPFKLLSFSAPEYGLDVDRASVTWAIAGGLLVSKPGQGRLKISVRRIPSWEGTPVGSARIRVDVEVSNFYPAIAHRISDHLYRWTQSKIHVIVTMGFLRSLAKGDLTPSVVGQFEPQAK